MGDEGIYINEYGSVLLFQCRTNTLKLGGKFLRVEQWIVCCVKERRKPRGTLLWSVLSCRK